MLQSFMVIFYPSGRRGGVSPPLGPPRAQRRPQPPPPAAAAAAAAPRAAAGGAAVRPVGRFSLPERPAPTQRLKRPPRPDVLLPRQVLQPREVGGVEALADEAQVDKTDRDAILGKVALLVDASVILNVGI
jgi:hypothetical protein